MQDMEFEANGHYVILERLQHESDSMLMARLKWLMSIPFEAKTFDERLRLSIFYHNVIFKGVRYPQCIHNRLGV